MYGLHAVYIYTMNFLITKILIFNYNHLYTKTGNGFLFPFFISAAFACGALEENNSGQAGFVLIWTFLNCLLLFVAGTVILFKYHTEYFLGALTASCVLMCSWMLQEAIVLGHFSDQSSGV